MFRIRWRPRDAHAAAPLEERVVRFQIPTDRTDAEIVAALEGVGAVNVRFYPPSDRSGRPMRGGYPE